MEDQAYNVPAAVSYVTKILPAKGCQIIHDGFDWAPIIEKAQGYWSNKMGVKEIAAKALQDLKNDDGASPTDHRKGTLLHKYIELFYKYRKDCATHCGAGKIFDVDSLFSEFTANEKLRGIKKDVIAKESKFDIFVDSMHSEFKAKGELRENEKQMVDENSGKFKEMHTSYSKELGQFYEFACNNKLTVDSVEQFIGDRKGKYDALFKMNDMNEYMLVDWIFSARIKAGSKSLKLKTLQLNMYKALLEQEDKNVTKMYCVAFHRERGNYDVFEIRDIKFTIPE